TSIITVSVVLMHWISGLWWKVKERFNDEHLKDVSMLMYILFTLAILLHITSLTPVIWVATKWIFHPANSKKDII
ncbi:hypothetical protein PFISCL1PPCAC_11838, partial [Pristionchus fissidentatus]